MSAKTRIKRPTTATPRNLQRGVMIHQSTHYGWVQPSDALGRPLMGAKPQFTKLARGNTLRRG